MNDHRDPHQKSHRTLRRVLIVVLVIAVLILAAALAVILPIALHQSAGGSGQSIPDGFVSSTHATGADDRTRTLSVETEQGEPADLEHLTPGEVLVVRGDGFDAGIGIYVAICAVPQEQGMKPEPCLGGVPEGATEGNAGGESETGEASEANEASQADEPLASVWITDDFAWRAFATQGWGPDGSFEARITVPPAAQDGLDCQVQTCAITTRADHTAGNDRVQDMQLRVGFTE